MIVNDLKINQKKIAKIYFFIKGLLNNTNIIIIKMNQQNVQSTLTAIANFFNNNHISSLLYLENNEFTSKLNPYDILPNQKIVYTHLPPNISIDKSSCFLLPKNFKHLICGQATGNGDCLYNSISIILWGNENFATNLRLSTVIELMKNAKFYLDKDVFENDITYSTTALDSSELAKKKFDNEILEIYPKFYEYIAEVKRISCNGSWSPLLAVYGLANIIECKVISIYPEIASRFIRDIYNCEISPRMSCNDTIYIFYGLI